MLGKQIEGYPPVNQLRKGNLYYMEGAANRYWIGIFKNFSNNSYTFIRVITHDPAGNPSKTYGYGATAYVMSLFKIRKLTTMELSLFINANYKAPAFDKLLTGKFLPKKRIGFIDNLWPEKSLLLSIPQNSEKETKVRARASK